nr:SWF/SNF helicase family protein [Opitutaceae bacterium]
MRHLAQLRMICDTPAIIEGQTCDDCPKLAELARILDEALADPEAKVIVFSEWEKMLALVRAHLAAQGLGHAWHTGSVSPGRRRAEIRAFRDDPACRVFLSTDCGGVGLNLQNASVVINCDLPWHPAKLEQRIARAWRKNQSRPVTVFNLVAEHTLEHGLLVSLAHKQELADGVLDGRGDLAALQLRRGRDALLQRIGRLLAHGAGPAPRGARSPAAPADSARAFAAAARARLGPRLLRCEETYPVATSAPAPRRGPGFVPAPAPAAPAPVILVVVDGSAAELRPHLEILLADTPWPEKQPRPSLQILDRASWTALETLAGTGLLTLHERASRPLLDAPAGSPQEPQALPAAAQARHDELRDLARRKARAAQALFDAALIEDATDALRAAALAHARSAAVAARSTEPADLAASLQEPCLDRWPAALRERVLQLARSDSAAFTAGDAAPLLRCLLA